VFIILLFKLVDYRRSEVSILEVSLNNQLKKKSVYDRMINECGAVDEMGTGVGNRSTWRKPAPATF
jgi:hypothetical protein